MQIRTEDLGGKICPRFRIWMAWDAQHTMVFLYRHDNSFIVNGDRESEGGASSSPPSQKAAYRYINKCGGVWKKHIGFGNLKASRSKHLPHAEPGLELQRLMNNSNISCLSRSTSKNWRVQNKLGPYNQCRKVGRDFVFPLVVAFFCQTPFMYICRPWGIGGRCFLLTRTSLPRPLPPPPF